MKNILFTVLFVAFGLQSFGQILVGNDERENTKITIRQSLTDLEVSQEFSFLELERMRTSIGEFFKINMGEEFVTSSKISLAELPVYTTLVEIPFCEDIVIEEQAYGERIFELEDGVKVYPKQASQSKQNEELPFEFNKEYYSTNSFGKQNRVEIEVLGIMNGVRLAKLSVSPIRYNPSANRIEFISRLDYTVRFVKADYQSTVSLRSKTAPSFSNFISDKTINPKNISASVNSSPISRPYKMVIVSSPMFEQALQPFIEWKTQQGFEIIELYTDQTGTSATSIKSYLKNLWENATEDNPTFDYLLLCGDVAQIPAFDGEYVNYSDGHPTDFYYAEYTNDMLPDVFYGRLSASTASQMQAIVTKTLSYEKYSFEDDSFLNKILLVAGKETNSPAPTCVNGQMNYAKQYFNGLDTSVYYNPSSGNKASEIRSKINDGQGWINYSAHCDESGWYSPSFLSSNVTSSTNIGKFGFYINNCCLSSKFDESRCFAEALLRANDKGAVGVIGSTNYTYWNEDFYWSVGAKNPTVNPNYNANALGAYDRVFHSHSESYDKWYTKAGQIVQAGNLAVEMSNSNLTNYYWEVYTLLGDPSLEPYVGVGLEFDADIAGNLPIGTAELSFENLPAYTYVGLSKNNTLIAAAQCDQEGNLNLEFEPITEPSDVIVVLSNQFYKPLIDTISIIAVNEPYILINEIRFTDDATGEIVDVLQPNKQYTLHFNAKNVGNQPLVAANLHLEWLEQITVLGSSDFALGTIMPQESSLCEQVFKFKTHDGIQNDLELDFVISISGYNYTNSKVIKKKVEAPELDAVKLNLIPQGENNQINVTLKNIGKLPSQNGIVSIESRSANLTLLNPTSADVVSLAPNAETETCFAVLVTQGEEIEFAISYIAGAYSIVKKYTVDVSGRIEDFESAIIPQEWQNDQTYPWILDSTVAKSGSCSLRSADISDDQSSVLTIVANAFAQDSISFDVKVSSENNYDFFKFYIDGTEKLSLSGTSSDAWKYRSFAVSPGEHTFKFEYVKDYSTSKGEDAAWIDNLKLPISGSATFIPEVETGQISIVPNPADNQVLVSLFESGSEVFIFDMNGKKMYERRNCANTIRIETSDMPSGVYTLCIKNGNTLKTEKLIIAR